MKKIFLTLLIALNLVLPVGIAYAEEPTDGATQADVVNPEGFLDSENNPANLEEDRNGFLNDSTVEVLKQFQEQTGFRSFGGLTNENAIQEEGLDNLTGIIYTVIDIIKYVVGILASLAIMISLVQLITAGSQKSEEEYGKVKDNIFYSIVAVITIISIQFFFERVFVVGPESFLDSTTAAQRFATIGAGEIRGIYNFISAAIASIAVFMLVFSGFRMVANAGDEEAEAKLKTQVIYSVLGLILVALSEFVVKDIVFTNGGTSFNLDTGLKLIVTMTNFISGFIGFLAFLSFIYAGYLYVVSGVTEDNTEKVKNIFTAGVIGIIVAASAFAVVNTVIRLDSSSAPEVLQNQLDTVAK
jgi:hypothetical protein